MIETKISIIVPIYNVEKYLNKCVESIINQTYKNLEIILVDDGSPDRCPEICDEYAKKDKRIIVIHKQNGGLSSARNAGLDVCSGKYIAFVDSDDFVDKKYIEELYELILKNNSDIAICGVNLVNQDGTLYQTPGYVLQNEIINKDKCKDLLFTGRDVKYVVAWNKLYKKSIWQNLRYPLNKIHEDEFVAYDILTSVHTNISTISKKLYYYVQRQSSITNSKEKLIKFFDIIEAKELRIKKLNKNYKYYNIALEAYLRSYFGVYKKVKADKSLAKKLKSECKKAYKKYKKDFSLKQKLEYFVFMNFYFIFIILGKG